MPAEQPVNLHEVFERVARKFAAGDVTLVCTEDVALHAPIPHRDDRRPDLSPESEAALRRSLVTGDPHPAVPRRRAPSEEGEAVPSPRVPRLRPPRGSGPYGEPDEQASDDGQGTRYLYGS